MSLLAVLPLTGEEPADGYEVEERFDGFRVVGSGRVDPFAFKEAGFLIRKMLDGREDILAALIEGDVRFAIMAHDEFTTDVPDHAHLTPKAYWDKRARGLGATKACPCVSCGEENLLGFKGDPYAEENILIHEFAHAIQDVGLRAVDETFDSRVEAAYDAAMAAGLWSTAYASSNFREYWAEGVQCWFDTNRENDNQHNHVDTRGELKEYDPGLAALCEEIFGDIAWRYERPPDRVPPSPHLEGYDPEKAPVFEWPKDVVAAYEAHLNGEGLDRVELWPPPAELAAIPPSERNTENVSMRVRNLSGEAVQMMWVGYDGEEVAYNIIANDLVSEHSTFAGHRWIVRSVETGEALWVFAAGSRGCAVTIR